MTSNPPPLYPVSLADGLILKPLRAEHSEQFFALVTAHRAHLERYDPFVTEFQTTADVRRVLTHIQDLYEHGQSLSCGIWDQDRLVGYFICGELQTGAAKTGYGLAADYQGRGIVTRTGQVVLDYAFRVMGMKSAWIMCWINNARSIHTAEQLGFQRQREIVPPSPEDGNLEPQYKYVLANPYRT